jgi:hypothetical protein
MMDMLEIQTTIPRKGVEKDPATRMMLKELDLKARSSSRRIAMAKIEDAHLDLVPSMVASLLLHQDTTVTIASPWSVASRLSRRQHVSIGCKDMT